MPQFSIPLTGLESDNTELNTIANNLANMSTVGFKAQITQFQDLFFQQFGTNGVGDPIQVGTGVGVAETQSDFSTGPISATGSASDMALDGNGFFIATSDGQTELTRAGDFIVSPTGQLITANGALVQGYPAVNGVVNTNAPLAGITLPTGQVEQPKATANLSLAANLDASAPSTPATVVPFSQTVYDSLGVPHALTITFTNTTTPNTWTYNIALPAGDATASTNTSGTLTFNSSGQLSSVPAGLSNITFTGLSDKAANLSLDLSTQASNGTSLLTQFSSSSAYTTFSADGYPVGQYSGYTTAGDGTISANFTNGTSVAVGRLAVGNVENQQGLTEIGGNDYLATLASGSIVSGTAGNSGNGTIEGASLEGSNVDISLEFSNLIVAQRAFEANSKSVTTFDTITQETINMIH